MKKRLDVLLVERGLVGSRERAKALIMEGKIKVDDRIVTKAGEMMDETASVAVMEEDFPYVGRGAIKLKAAIEHFKIELNGKTAMDVGAGTGGFTDYMLSMGARKVYAVDVGYGQFDWRLRNDPRVTLIERTNIRYLPKENIPEEMDIIVIDVSFISLTKVVPKALEFLKRDGELVALIKPQFEVGKGEVGKGGIVRDEEKRLKTVASVREALEGCGLHTVGVIESPIKGQKGNIEYLIFIRRA